MQRFILLTFLTIYSFAARSQEKVTLNGYIRDASNGEELIGVTIYIPQLKAGTVTNDYGFYALTIPKGTYEVQYSYIGYEQRIETIEIQDGFFGIGAEQLRRDGLH